MSTEPVAELDPRYSEEGVPATPWSEARAFLETAPIWWVTTVRPDGRPHVTPLLAVWQDAALHFCTGPQERKARNLEGNPHVVLTSTDQNALHEGLDLVVEGDAQRITDDAHLRRLADAWVDKYTEEWRFSVRDGAFFHGEDAVRSDDHGPAWVFAVAPATAHAYRRGTYSQTRYRF